MNCLELHLWVRMSVPGEGVDLLIVDDDSGHARLLRILMQELGLPHRCHHVLDAEAAMLYLMGKEPYAGAPRCSLVLLDLNLPGKTGRELLREIKADPALMRIPVIMLSQSTSPVDVEACYSERANAYIGKPQDLESNLEMLRDIDRFWLQVASLPESEVV